MGDVQNSLLRLRKGVCVDRRNRSRAREVAQKRTGPVMAKMCRRAHSAFKSLFGTRRRKESQTCGQGTKTRNEQAAVRTDDGSGPVFLFLLQVENI